MTAEDQAAVVLAHLDEISEALETGSIVIFDDDRLRLRFLPIVRAK
jgi:hypothetical protein